MREGLHGVAGALLLAAVLGCGPGEEASDPFAGTPVYRDLAVPVASAALFEPTRFAGGWHEVARFPVAFRSACATARWEFGAPADNRFSLTASCTEGDGTTRHVPGGAVVTGPGRLGVSLGDGPFIAQDLWVLWVDEGYRTAVVATPDGRAGWIWNRDPAIPADRLAAAREVLDFNGFDLDRLQVAGQ